MQTTQSVSKDNLPLYGTIYSGTDKLGDFNWMCKQPAYTNVLFIFNDNEEFHDTCRTGRGNAIIRKYNKHNEFQKKPKSAGIPTGTLALGGYTQLDTHVIKKVDQAIEEIRELINQHNYNAIFYSVTSSGKLGTGLFDVGKDVIEYIDEKIKSLTKMPLEILRD